MSAPYASSLARDVHLGEESETQLVYIGEGGDGIVTKITQGDKIWVRKQVCDEVANSECDRCLINVKIAVLQLRAR